MRCSDTGPQAKLLLIGGGCNNNCLYCPYKGKSFDTDPVKIIEKIRDRKPQEEEIIFAGREPPIHPSFIDFLEEAKKSYKVIEVLTNGRIFSVKKFARKALLAGLTDVEIKFFSSDPEIHDSITRVPGSWEQTVKGIRNLLYFSRVFPPFFRPSLSVGVYVGEKNAPTVQETVEFLEKLGVREIFLINVGNVKLERVESKVDLFTIGFPWGTKYGEYIKKRRVIQPPSDS